MGELAIPLSTTPGQPQGLWGLTVSVPSGLGLWGTRGVPSGNADPVPVLAVSLCISCFPSQPNSIFVMLDLDMKACSSLVCWGREDCSLK